MVFFRRIRNRAHDLILSRNLKKTHHAHQTCGYHQASTIALLFDGTNPKNMEPVKNYHQHLRSLNKKVHLLCYIEKERPGEALSFDYITRRNLNWCFIPEGAKAAHYMNTRYDLLICLCTQECLPLEYISALSNAVYRVGRYIPHKTFCFDLMIHLNGKSDVKFLIDEVERYLLMIKIA